MELSAILVINEQLSANNSATDFVPAQLGGRARGPLSCAEIFGKSILDRTIERLRKDGINRITVIGGANIENIEQKRKVDFAVCPNPLMRWTVAQRILQHESAGVETALMIGLSPYWELSVADALNFYRDRGGPLTQLEDKQGPLDFWIVDSNWFRTTASDCTMPFRYGEFPGLPVPHRVKGYVNRLAEARDLRRLVLDSFLGRCEIRPRGRELRPGIWVEDGAHVHKFARLVAPVYVGNLTRVGSSSVLTGFSNIERNCQIGEGTVVDGSTVLQHTVLGADLDVSHAVVSGNRFVDWKRNVAVQIDDPVLVRDAAPPVEWNEQKSCSAGLSMQFDFSQYLTRAANRLTVLLRG